MDLTSIQDAIDEWKNDFKGYINALNMPKDDYNGIMEYINELPSAQPDPCVFCKFGDGDCWEVCQYCPVERRIDD